jgi:hypothetical protein
LTLFSGPWYGKIPSAVENALNGGLDHHQGGIAGYVWAILGISALYKCYLTTSREVVRGEDVFQTIRCFFKMTEWQESFRKGTSPITMISQ